MGRICFGEDEMTMSRPNDFRYGSMGAMVSEKREWPLLIKERRDRFVPSAGVIGVRWFHALR